MPGYFSKFPLIRHNDKIVRDITRRVNLIEENRNTPFLFLPYTVKQGEKPEDIAYYYYGSVNYTWLVLYSNNIIDPYLEWLMTDDQLNRYIIEKYEAQSGKTGLGVIEWTQNETISDNIVFYYDDGRDLAISKESATLPGNENFRPLRIYEYETRLNDLKSEIKLIDRSFLSRIENEFTRIIRQ